MEQALLILEFLNGDQGVYMFDSLYSCLHFEFYHLDSSEIVASSCELAEPLDK